jgi:hypothetical protein
MLINQMKRDRRTDDARDRGDGSVAADRFGVEPANITARSSTAGSTT